MWFGRILDTSEQYVQDKKLPIRNEMNKEKKLNLLKYFNSFNTT